MQIQLNAQCVLIEVIKVIVCEVFTEKYNTVLFSTPIAFFVSRMCVQ